MIILELEDTDTIAFDEILAFLKQHPEFEKYTLDKEPVLSLPGLEIRPDEQKVYRNNREVKLTVKEYKILCLLVLNRNRVLTYEQIYRRIWGEDAIGNETNAVGCHVRNLRRKLLQAAPDPPIQTPVCPGNRLLLSNLIKVILQRSDFSGRFSLMRFYGSRFSFVFLKNH